MVFTEVVVLKITASSSKVTLFAYATYLNVRRARGENTPHSKIALLVFVCLGEVHTIAEAYCAPFLIFVPLRRNRVLCRTFYSKFIKKEYNFNRLVNA